MKYFLLFSILFPAVNFAQEFSLAFESKSQSVKYFQLRSYLKIIRAKNICEGSFYPHIMQDWKCREVAKNMQKCAADFVCRAPFTKNAYEFDVRSTVVKMKELPTPNEKVKTIVSKKSSEKYLLSDTRIKYPEEKIEHPGSFAPQVLKTSKVEVVQTKKEEKEENLFYLPDPNEERDPELVSLREDAVEKRELMRQEKVEGSWDQKFNLKNFSFSYLSVSDDDSNSFTSFNGAWTPYYWHTKNLALRGELGLHSYQFETLNGEKDSFWVTSFFGYGHYRINNFYAELGLGLEKFNSDEGGSYSVLSMGGGYYFKNKLLSYIDRVFINYNSISSEIPAKELRIGFGIVF
ncbi:hypothetical protein M899_2484 [Bacteriovorax sp. BSW11_IV]|uniref:hypothetical protein n=1 Tax=Bacteriovorax sp. BSW11_IV TaxID=1353529 RepID=UPI00038A3D70|nr:hypothetical protein [Bacteriovorax sp. BSW11_IV]EQC44512.1 hypothetical protein M899_2484 [Bacteriovorax sp. BSW11_IV]